MSDRQRRVRFGDPQVAVAGATGGADSVCNGVEIVAAAPTVEGAAGEREHAQAAGRSLSCASLYRAVPRPDDDDWDDEEEDEEEEDEDDLDEDDPEDWEYDWEEGDEEEEGGEDEEDW